MNLLAKQQDLAEAGDDAQRKYEDEMEEALGTSKGLIAAIFVTMEAKRQKLSASFNKLLIIAN